MFAEERPPHKKFHSNDNTIQQCRPKPSPSSTAVPVRHDPVQGDVRHQDVQGVGQVRAEEEGTPRPLPAQGDAHHLDTQERKLGRVPGKGGGQAQAEEERVPRPLPAQGDVHHQAQAEGTGPNF